MSKKTSTDYPETHRYGAISLENLDLFDLSKSRLIKGDLGVQIASDGRVWICINGVAFIRFKPLEKEGG